MLSIEIEKQTLYRFFDSNGQLLYVGISNNWIARLHQHYKHSEWFTHVASATFEHFDTRKEVEFAELKAIRTEGAIYNKAFNPNFESPTIHFQKIKSWVYYGIEPDEKHTELITDLIEIQKIDSAWSKKTSADLAYYLIERLPQWSPDCEFCEHLFHSNQVNNWATQKRKERKNATN